MDGRHLVILVLLVTQHECRLQLRNIPAVLDAATHIWAPFFPMFDNIDSNNMPQNTFYSPVGLHTVMALLSFATDEDSKDQLRDAGRIPYSDITVGKAFKKIMRLLETDSSAEVSFANGLFVSNDTTLYSHFKALIRKYFESEIMMIDFEDHEEAVFLLNEWTKYETNDKISDIAESISPDTKFTILDAIYFKALWKIPFPLLDDNKQDFNNYDGTVESIDFMENVLLMVAEQNERLESYVLVLPYENDDYHMVLILPNPEIDVLEVQDRLIEDETIPIPETTQNVRLQIPKFRLLLEYDLKEGLQDLGVVDIFDKDKANLLRMTRDPIYVDGVIQATYLDVDEQGTEAAGATLITGLGSVRPKPPSPPIDIKFDRPFLLAIIHEETGIPLFFGRVTKLGNLNHHPM